GKCHDAQERVHHPTDEHAHVAQSMTALKNEGGHHDFPDMKWVTSHLAARLSQRDPRLCVPASRPVCLFQLRTNWDLRWGSVSAFPKGYLGHKTTEVKKNCRVGPRRMPPGTQ